MRLFFSTRPRLRALCWGLYAGLLAFLIVALFVERYGVDVPYWDEWVELPFYAALRRGTLTWGDLFAQHNEHRILVSRIISVLLYRLVGEWNVVVQMTFSAAVMGLTVAVLGYTLARLRVSPLLIVALSVLLTSPVQWDNILWGYQIHVFTLLFGTVLAICAVALDDALRPRTIALAVAGCAIATFSFASGLAVWIAIAATLALRGLLIAGSPRALIADRALSLRFAVFAAAAAMCIAAFFVGYAVVRNPLGAPSLLAVAWWIVRVLTYPLLDTAAPLANVVLGVALWGCVALAMRRYVRARQSVEARNRLILFVGILLVLAGNAVITGYGRGGTPYVPSRYGTLLLLISVPWLVAIADLARGDAAMGPPPAAVRVVLCALAVGLLLVHGNRYREGLTIMQSQGPNRETAREALAFYLSDHGPALPFAGFAVFPPHVQQQGDLGRPELLAVLPPDVQPALTALPAAIQGDAWAPDCAYEGTAGAPPAQRWGSWCRRGAAGVGRIRIGPIAIHDPLLRVPIAGYLGSPGAALVIQDAADARHRLPYAGPPPGDAWSEWTADVSSFVGRDVYLFGDDSARDAPGWMAFGGPRPMSRALDRLDRASHLVAPALRVLLLATAGVLLALSQIGRRQ